MLCPGSPAAQYRALGGLEKGHRLQVDADRAFAEMKCPLVPVDLPPLGIQDSMGRGPIGFHSDLPLSQVPGSRAPLEDRLLMGSCALPAPSHVCTSPDLRFECLCLS